MWRGAGEFAREFVDLVFLAAGDDNGGEAAERRHAGDLALFRFRRQEAGAVAMHQRLHNGRSGS